MANDPVVQKFLDAEGVTNDLAVQLKRLQEETESYRTARVALGEVAQGIGSVAAEMKGRGRQYDRSRVKGKEEERGVYQGGCEASDDVTRIEISTGEVKEETKYLALEFQGTQQRLTSDDHRTFVIGRGVQSDLLCKTRLASRAHATLEFRRGKFLLTDQSSNGTFIRTDDGEEIFLRRQELMLWGSGYISLGEEIYKEDPNDVSRYICE